MNLKEYNPNNCTVAGGPCRYPASISLDSERGLFVINRSAAALMELEDKDRIVIHQDEEDPENWYLEIVADRGFVIRLSKTWANYKFNNIVLARKISESVGFKGRTGKMLIAGKPTKIGRRVLWGILAIGLKNI